MFFLGRKTKMLFTTSKKYEMLQDRKMIELSNQGHHA